MATSEEIGGISVAITGDYSSLPATFDAVSILARNFAGRFSQIIGTAGPALDSLGSSFIKTGSAMTIGVTAPIVALGAVMASGIDDFRKFELSMRQVTSLMGTVSQSEFKALSDATLELSTRLGVDAVNAAKGLYEAISAGVPKENAITFLEVASKTAIAGLTNTKVAVDGLTTVLNSFHLETSKTKEVADAMFMAVNLGKFTFEQLAASMSKAMPIAAQVGVSFKEVLAAAATLTKQGVPVSEAMTQIARAITSIVAPSKEMQAVFAKIGVESGKVLLETRGLEGALQAIREATGGVESDMFKAMRRMEGFRALLGLTGENAKGAAEDLKAVTNSTGAMDLAFKEIEKSGARGFDSLKVAMKNLSIQAAEVLAPAIAQIVKNMQPLIEGTIDLIKWFAKLDPAIQQTTGIMLVMVASAGPLALMAGWFLKLREAALVLVPSIMSVTGALNLLAKVPYVALVASFAALIKATYDWKTARDSMHKSEQEERDGLAKLEISLRQAGVNISELSNQYNHGLIGQTEYIRGLQTLAKEHGDALPKVKGLKDGLTDLGNVPPPIKIPGAIKDIGTAAKESKNSIDEFMESWNRQFQEAVPTTEDLAKAMRDVARAAYEDVEAITALPPVLDAAAGASANLAEMARYAQQAMDSIVPPELPAKIEEVTKKTATWGEVTVTASDRSKESIREIRRAVESISDALARSIIHWKGWKEGAINVLEAVGEAILKTIIKRILDATGLVDKLMDGIVAVLSKIGIGAASGAAGAVASNAAAKAIPPTGTTAPSGAAGSLSNILGFANLGVSIASGISEGIQNAHMEADIAKIEISTRQTKEQLVGGIQPSLNQWLPKLDYLLDIWKELREGFFKIVPAVLENTRVLNNILSDGGKGLGGGFWGSSGSPGGGTWEEIMQMLKLLTQPTSGGTTGQPVGGATEPIMSSDTARKLSRGFDVLATALTSGYQLKPGEQFASAPTRGNELTTAQALQIGGQRTGLLPEQFKILVESQFKAHPDWYPLGTSASDIFQPRFSVNALSTDPLERTQESAKRDALERYRAGLISLTQYEAELARATQEYQAAMLPAARAAEEQRRATDPLVQAMNASAEAQQALTARTMELLRANGGHSAVDLGDMSFINVGGSSGPTPGQSAAEFAASVQSYAGSLNLAFNDLMQKAVESNARAGDQALMQFSAAYDKMTRDYDLVMDVTGRFLQLTQQGQLQGYRKGVAGAPLETLGSYTDLYKDYEDFSPENLARTQANYAEYVRGQQAKMLAEYASTGQLSGQTTIQGFYRQLGDRSQWQNQMSMMNFGPNSTRELDPWRTARFFDQPMGGNSYGGGGSVPITIIATDSSARSIGNGLIQVLQQNGIYR